MAISSTPGDIIKTFALASCVGVAAYCSELPLAGLIHIVLPHRPECGEANPGPSYYASTGVPLFIRRLREKGCELSRLSVRLYGGADAQNADDCFNIGKRNLKAVQSALDRLGVSYVLADVGGFLSRTLYFDVATGKVKVNTLPIVF